MGHTPKLRERRLKRFDFPAENIPAALSYSADRLQRPLSYELPLTLEVILKNHGLVRAHAGMYPAANDTVSMRNRRSESAIGRARLCRAVRDQRGSARQSLALPMMIHP